MIILISFVGGSITQGSAGDATNISYLTLAFAGFVTAFTMMLPGVSGYYPAYLINIILTYLT